MSEKNRDAKNRWRTVTVAFRLSPEENEELTTRVKMCGCRTRQEYIIQSILHQKVVATGNPLMLVSFRQNLQHIEAELERLQKVDEMDSELLTPIRTMLEILEAFRETPPISPALSVLVSVAPNPFRPLFVTVPVLLQYAVNSAEMIPALADCL